MNVNELVKEAHQIAKDKGWHDTTRTPLEIHALIHSEISEATEAVRNPVTNYAGILNEGVNGTKPEGEAIELADAIIRIADYFGARGWDLQEAVSLKLDYNKGRSYRHGNKKY